MIEFDSYVPSTWLDSDGILLVVTTQQKKKPKAKRARTFRVLTAAATAFAIGMASTDLPLSVAEYANGDRVVLSGPVAPIAEMLDDVAPGYWPKLVRLVRASRTLPADDTSGDPTPLA